MNSFYSADELKTLGFKKFGEKVMISRKSSFYSPEKIVIGNHVRIDDFCILSGKIQIGNFVHINPFNGIFAGDSGVFLHDYVNLSSQITIYAVSDDYSGKHFTSPLLPESRQYMLKSTVQIDKYSIIGTGTSILPGVHIAEGCAIGARSLVKTNTEAWSIYAGTPVRFIKERSKDFLYNLPHGE